MKHLHLTISLRRAVRLTRNSLFGLCACVALLIALLVFPYLSHATGDADRGKQLFEKRCTGCHSLDQDKEGPRLRGVYGRQAGKISSFKYSTALQSAHVTWDDDSLDKWLTDTDSLIADNDMAYRVPKADERADIIRFLETVSMK
jgi:cytochrome c